MKLQPLADRVVIKMVEAEETTKSGIILTRLCRREAPDRRSDRRGPGPEGQQDAGQGWR